LVATSVEGQLIINTVMAPAEWAARVSKQAEQMLIIAAATNDDEMRDELLDFAERLTVHASEIEASDDGASARTQINDGWSTQRALFR
jgi:hypothetical protein